MDEVIVEREEMIALNPEKDREQQKKKWRPFSGCYKITIAFLMGVLLATFLIRYKGRSSGGGGLICTGYRVF